MKPVVLAADAQSGACAGGKWGGGPCNGMQVYSLVHAEARLRGLPVLILRLRAGGNLYAGW